MIDVCDRQQLAAVLFFATFLGCLVGAFGLVLHRWLNRSYGYDWLVPELERAVAATNDEVTKQHLKAIIMAALH